MFLAEKLHEKVFYYQDVVEDPQGLVALIEELDSDESTHPAIPAWGPWLSNSRDGYSFGGKKDFNPEAVATLDSPRKDDVARAISTIRKAVDDVAEAYYRDLGLDGKPNMSPFVGIMKYTPGCSMGAHFDAQAGDLTLKYSIVLYLNENYEGGEISFAIRDYDLRDPKYSDMKPLDDVHDPDNEGRIDFWLKPKPGSALIFPSTHPFMHRVHEMKSGDKYIFPGFVFIDEFDPEDPAMREKYNAGSAKLADDSEVLKTEY
jgi:hypothetical protein